MAFSKVSSILLFLLFLALVFPHMDKALGEQMQHRKLKTEHSDQLGQVQRRVLLGFGSAVKEFCKKYCKKAPKLVDHLPKPPPPPPRFPKGLPKRFPTPPRFSKGKNT
ncbi:hypothetical protein HA466_0284370 [Hirschfeldia incana]|nr:hypothetical protein HA466_0284370 [Hirschfeldia incana]